MCLRMQTHSHMHMRVQAPTHTHTHTHAHTLYYRYIWSNTVTMTSVGMTTRLYCDTNYCLIKNILLGYNDTYNNTQYSVSSTPLEPS